MDGGWKSQVALASKLGISKSAVSMYLKGGKSSPSERTLKDLRALVIGKGSENIPFQHPKRGALDDLAEKIAYLEAHDPPGFDAARLTVDALHRMAIEKRSMSKAPLRGIEKAPDTEIISDDDPDIISSAIAVLKAEEKIVDRELAQEAPKVEGIRPSGSASGPMPAALGGTKSPRPGRRGPTRK